MSPLAGPDCPIARQVGGRQDQGGMMIMCAVSGIPVPELMAARTIANSAIEGLVGGYDGCDLICA